MKAMLMDTEKATSILLMQGGASGAHAISLFSSPEYGFTTAKGRRTFQSISSVLFSRGISNGMNEHQEHIKNQHILRCLPKKKKDKKYIQYIYVKQCLFQLTVSVDFTLYITNNTEISLGKKQLEM